jgi:hypothetical protein
VSCWPLIYIKFLIDGYITRPYWFWKPNSVFGLWAPILAFSTHKSMYSSSIYNFRSMDISHDHTDFWPQIPFLGSDSLFFPFRLLKVHIFMIYTKFPIDWWVTCPIWFSSPLAGAERPYNKVGFSHGAPKAIVWGISVGLCRLNPKS